MVATGATNIIITYALSLEWYLSFGAQTLDTCCDKHSFWFQPCHCLFNDVWGHLRLVAVRRKKLHLCALVTKSALHSSSCRFQSSQLFWGGWGICNRPNLNKSLNSSFSICLSDQCAHEMCCIGLQPFIAETSCLVASLSNKTCCKCHCWQQWLLV